MKTKYTKELLTPIVKESRSFSQLITKLGLKVTGGNFQYIKSKVILNKIDHSHFLGKGWNKGDILGLRQMNTTPLKQLLKRNTHYSTDLPKKIIKANLKPYQCELCLNAGEWRSEKLTLQMDHINGDRTDNRLKNLRFLCPNCHSQTSTFGNKRRPRNEPV